MQFVIADKNIRVWSAAVASLARIGKTISLEWRDSELVLRTLTDTQSAFAAFYFSTSFFESVTDPSTLPADEAKEVTKTKFAARVLAAAAKHPRGVARLHAYFARQDAEHVFVLRAELKNGLVRTHTLTFEDAVILQPLFKRELAPFQIAARPSMFHTVLDRMHGTEGARRARSGGARGAARARAANSPAPTRVRAHPARCAQRFRSSRRRASCSSSRSTTRRRRTRPRRCAARCTRRSRTRSRSSTARRSTSRPRAAAS